MQKPFWQEPAHWALERQRKPVRPKQVVDEVRAAGVPWLVRKHTGHWKESGSHSECNEKPSEVLSTL